MADYLFKPIVGTINVNRYSNCRKVRSLFRAVIARIAKKKEFAAVGSRLRSLIFALVRTIFTDRSMTLRDGIRPGDYACTRKLLLSKLHPAFEPNKFLLEFVFEMWTCGYATLHSLSEVVTAALNTDPLL